MFNSRDRVFFVSFCSSRHSRNVIVVVVAFILIFKMILWSLVQIDKIASVSSRVLACDQLRSTHTINKINSNNFTFISDFIRYLIEDATITLVEEIRTIIVIRFQFHIITRLINFTQFSHWPCNAFRCFLHPFNHNQN